MMRPFKADDLEEFFSVSNKPPPELIKRPPLKRKQKAYRSYYNWWLRQQYMEIWWMQNCDMPFDKKKNTMSKYIGRKND